MLFIGESAGDATELADVIAETAAGRNVRIFSGHDSLIRDFAVAHKLREGRAIVASQSGLACAVGLDKVLQKRLMESVGVAVPRWGLSDRQSPNLVGVLCKRREGTQSRGIGWRSDRLSQSAPSYWEEFVDGVEYSIVLHRNSRGTWVFPAVWKGRTSRDLVPPWRRLRTIPSGLPVGLEEALQDTARRIVDLIEAWGFVEIEFIVPLNGEPVVTDINPRVCGTLRISAMATASPIFSDEFDLHGEVFAKRVCYAAEVPHRGHPILTADLIATSRLTCCGDSADAVRSKIGRATPAYGDAVMWPSWWI